MLHIPLLNCADLPLLINVTTIINCFSLYHAPYGHYIFQCTQEVVL